jgi:hypothetical protein
MRSYARCVIIVSCRYRIDVGCALMQARHNGLHDVEHVFCTRYSAVRHEVLTVVLLISWDVDAVSFGT